MGNAWFGSKATAGLCQALIALMPPQSTYIKTHLGGGAIMKRKPGALHNIGIDLDERAISGFEQGGGLGAALRGHAAGGAPGGAVRDHGGRGGVAGGAGQHGVAALRVRRAQGALRVAARVGRDGPRGE